MKVKRDGNIPINIGNINNYHWNSHLNTHWNEETYQHFPSTPRHWWIIPWKKIPHDMRRSSTIHPGKHMLDTYEDWKRCITLKDSRHSIEYYNRNTRISMEGFQFLRFRSSGTVRISGIPKLTMVKYRIVKNILRVHFRFITNQLLVTITWWRCSKRDIIPAHIPGNLL